MGKLHRCLLPRYCYDVAKVLLHCYGIYHGLTLSLIRTDSIAKVSLVYCFGFAIVLLGCCYENAMVIP